MCEQPTTALGPLLVSLGYMEETTAAAELGISVATLAGWRKAQKGPQHTELARTILYSKDVIAKWLADGGSRER